MQPFDWGAKSWPLSTGSARYSALPLRDRVVQLTNRSLNCFLYREGGREYGEDGKWSRMAKKKKKGETKMKERPTAQIDRLTELFYFFGEQSRYRNWTKYAGEGETSD